MRTGDEYLKSLAGDRTVCVDGERVPAVADHPAFAPIATTIGSLLDLAADPASGMQIEDPVLGRPVNRVHTISRSAEELAAKGRAYRCWADATHGWVGRSPDHVGSFLSAFAAHPEVFAVPGAEIDFAANVTAFHQRVLREDLYVSYAIIPPQTARTPAVDAWKGELVQVGVKEATAEGLVVQGAQMLATGAAVADELFVSCIKPLGPEDGDFAISFAVPVATRGLTLYCRRPYAPAVTSPFDYPLSARFDETDALVVFDDVLVPWDRVFVDRSVERVRDQFFATGAHVLGNWQAQNRFAVKLQFLAGLAYRVAESNQALRFPGVVEKLGELASLVSFVESAVIAAEHGAAPDETGQWLPGRRAVYGAMGHQAELYPRVLAVLRDLAGGGVLQLPSSAADFANPGIRADLDRYVAGGSSAEDRVKLFKLAWDAIGSEFAGRHHQYEMFYAGAPFVAKGYAMRNYDFASATASVDRFLASYSL